MEREAYRNLLEWKQKKDRKPLVLFGARQTGKTWLLKEFGKHEYQNLAYINCDGNADIANAFQDFDTERLIRVFSAMVNEKILEEKTLIVLDEIQEVPLALTSLKYFCENAPGYHIAAAGSLLGIAVHKGTGFPVGKVDEMTLYPMSFLEFIKAGGKERLHDLMDMSHMEEMKSLHESCTELLRQYYYVGGMPEVVREYFEKKDIQNVRKIQNRILSDYRHDFSKHIPSVMLSKVNMVWDSIPYQLAKENKKFLYGSVKKGGRAREFEDAIQWLCDAGLVLRVNRVNKVAMPLKFYEDFGAFKLFLNDLGLLAALSEAPAAKILNGSGIFEEYKGSFTEQYVEQQLVAEGLKPYYYSNENSTMEVDFVVQKDSIYPIEVKAEENLRSKSLRTVIETNHGMKGIRFSMSHYRDQEWMVNIPLYAVSAWAKAVESE